MSTMKPKKRPKALRWDVNDSIITAEIYNADKDPSLEIESDIYCSVTIRTKSQCRKLRAWLTKAEKWLK